MKCLLRLNEPQLALSTAESFIAEAEASRKNENDHELNELHAHQLEAVWQLRNWSKLGPMLEVRRIVFVHSLHLNCKRCSSHTYHLKPF